MPGSSRVAPQESEPEAQEEAPRQESPRQDAPRQDAPRQEARQEARGGPPRAARREPSREPRRREPSRESRRGAPQESPDSSPAHLHVPPEIVGEVTVKLPNGNGHSLGPSAVRSKLSSGSGRAVNCTSSEGGMSSLASPRGTAPWVPSPVPPTHRVELHRLPFDERGYVRDQPACGNNCLFVRGASNTSDPQQVCRMLQDVCRQEAELGLPEAQRLFPKGKLAIRPCFVLSIKEVSSRFELRVRPGREEFARQRCRDKRWPEPREGGLVLWRKTSKLLKEAAAPLLDFGRMAASGRMMESGNGFADQGSAALQSLTATESCKVTRVCGDQSPSSPSKTTKGKCALGWEDEDFIVVEDKQLTAAARLRSCLQTIVELAQSVNAALIYPCYRYHTCPVMFSAILKESNFTGPLVHIGSECETVVEWPDGNIPEPVLKANTFKESIGHYRLDDKECVWTRATHALLVGDSCKSFELGRLAAAVARAVSGRSGDLLAEAGLTGAKAGAHGCIGILSNGGRIGLRHMAEGVRQKIPYLVLEGSGRLSDYLPITYVQRASPNFDAYEAAKKIVETCGFSEKPDPADGAAVEKILTGNITIHQLSHGKHALMRLFSTCFVGQDQALQEAHLQRQECLSTARRLRRPDLVLHVIYLLATIFVTFLSVMLNDMRFKDEHDCEVVETDKCSLTAGECHPLRYVVTIMPVACSILLSLRVDLKYDQAAKSLVYAARLIDRAMWEYVTHAGVFADCSMISHQGDTSPTSSDHPQTDVVLDTTSIRAQKLTEQIVDIIEQYVGDLPKWSKRRGSSEDVYKDSVAFVNRNYAVDSVGEEYIQKRLEPELQKWNKKGKRAEKQLILFKVLSYAFGATGSILALLELEAWVTVTTVLVTSLAALNARAPVEERRQKSWSTMRALQEAMLQFQAVPAELRGKQHAIDSLVLRTEDAILAAASRPMCTDKTKGEDRRGPSSTPPLLQ